MIERSKTLFKAVVRLAQDGRYTSLTERKIEPLVFAMLSERWGTVHREVAAVDPLRQRARIDFRYGTTNRVFIELAVRPRSGGQQLEATQNAPELRKLSHIRQSRGKLRLLVLLDLSLKGLSYERLFADYKQKCASAIDMESNSIQLLYVHRSEAHTYCPNRRRRAT